jgi:hypothetical protein
MGIDILTLVSDFENIRDHESSTAVFRTHVPWVGSSAYLHVVFKPAPPDLLSHAATELKMPVPFVDFLRIQNGAVLFSGALSIYGIHSRGQLLNRDDPDFVLPFNVEDENQNWPPPDRAVYLSIGGYSFDGSRVCINRNDGKVYLFERGTQSLLRSPSHCWENIEQLIISEVMRLAALFDRRGKRLVDESQMLPVVGPPS